MSNLDTSTQAMLRCAQALQDATNSLPPRFVRGVFGVNRGGTDQVGLTASAFNKVEFTHKLADQDNWFDAGTNYRYTPQLPGLYLFHLTVKGTYVATTEMTVAAIYRNGVVAAQGTFLGTPASNSLSTSSATALLLCNGTTDYVEGFAYIPAGALSFEGDVFETFMFGLRLTGV